MNHFQKNKIHSVSKDKKDNYKSKEEIYSLNLLIVIKMNLKGQK